MNLQSSVEVMPLAQLAQSQRWSLELMHPQEDHLLIWTTRGQGLITLQGIRRGYSAHNAIFIPAGHIWAAELGRQTLGFAIRVPDNGSGRFPDDAQLLRVKDTDSQNEL